MLAEVDAGRISTAELEMQTAPATAAAAGRVIVAASFLLISGLSFA